MTMCENLLHDKEKHCLKETIECVLKSIEKGEKKLRKLFKDDNKPTRNI